MSDSQKKELVKQYAICLGDDALVLGHRLSEWCRKGPFLEEDIALTNIALDYIGRARLFYGYAAELSGNTQTEDDFAYSRDCRGYRNLLIYELPKIDFAYTMARQLIVDIFYSCFLPELKKSTDQVLSAIAEKAIKETQYHLRRSIDWILRLGDGTEESHIRMQTAFDQLWGYINEMFELDQMEQQLVDQRIAVDTTELESSWRSRIIEVMTEATLKIPKDDWVVRGGRKGYHTEHLGDLLVDLQYLQHKYPSLQW